MAEACQNGGFWNRGRIGFFMNKLYKNSIKKRPSAPRRGLFLFRKLTEMDVQFTEDFY